MKPEETNELETLQAERVQDSTISCYHTLTEAE